MVELGSPDSMELGREIPGSQALDDNPADWKGKYRLLIAILSTASFLAILIWGTMMIRGTGSVLAFAPWYIPLVSSFISLIAFLVGYLALRRYQVLRDPVSFWVGRIQADEDVVQADFGKQANIAYTAGSNVTGVSATELDSSTIAEDAALVLTLVGLYTIPGNALATNYTQVIVKINCHLYGSAGVANTPLAP